jgi:hypothetical protein
MTLNELQEYIYGELGFCGCGLPEETIALLRDVLSVIESDEPNYKALLPLLDHKKTPGLVYTYLYLLDDKGLTDHGSGVMACWLTDKGSELLDSLRQYTTQEICEWKDKLTNRLSC